MAAVNVSNVDMIQGKACVVFMFTCVDVTVALARAAEACVRVTPRYGCGCGGEVPTLS